MVSPGDAGAALVTRDPSACDASAPESDENNCGPLAASVIGAVAEIPAGLRTWMVLGDRFRSLGSKKLICVGLTYPTYKRRGAPNWTSITLTPSSDSGSIPLLK